MAATSLSALASCSDKYKGGAVFLICEDILAPYAYEIYSIGFQSLRTGSGSGSRSRSRSGSGSGSGSGSPRLPVPKPVNRLKRGLYPDGMGFFSDGSNIYMVGGVMFDRPKRKDHPCNSVYVYDTVANSVMPGPSMLRPKVNPFVIGPVNGKVYVHSHSLHDHNFELFELETQKWSALPCAPVPSAEPPFGHYIPSQEYDIITSAVVENTILLTTFGGHTFTFNIRTKRWNAVESCHLPFSGGAVLADDKLYGFPNYSSSDFPLSTLRVKCDPYELKLVEEASVKDLPRPAGNISHAHVGYVAYLGNQHFCAVRSGFDGSPFSYHYDPPTYYVTIDLFRIESESRCSRHDGRVKSRCLFAVDHRSFSCIMDDNRPKDADRILRFAAPILRPAVTKG